MALYEMPTGILPEELVETLPKTGEEHKVYRRLVEDEALREMQVTDDFIWHNGEWLPFSFDAKVFGAYFAIYQKSVADTITSLEARIAQLEPIHFVGLDDLTVDVGEEFDPLDGVTATGCNDSQATVAVEV